jgi:hypothetical protein
MGDSPVSPFPWDGVDGLPPDPASGRPPETRPDWWPKVGSGMYRPNRPVVQQPASAPTSLGIKMLDYISAGVNRSTVLEVAVVLVPASVLLWIILTVSALHKRDACFWSPRFDVDQRHRLSDSPGHHVPRFMEPGERTERTPLPCADRRWSDPLSRRVRVRDLLQLQYHQIAGASCQHQPAATACHAGRDLPVPSMEGQRGQPRPIADSSPDSTLDSMGSSNTSNRQMPYGVRWG